MGTALKRREKLFPLTFGGFQVWSSWDCSRISWEIQSFGISSLIKIFRDFVPVKKLQGVKMEEMLQLYRRAPARAVLIN